MARPNYRHVPREKKYNPFLESVKKLLVSKEREEQESTQTEEMEDGFLKTRPREYAYGQDEPEEERFQEENTVAKQGITLSTSACVTAFVTILTSVGFAFLFGLIIGKGMTPAVQKEEPVPLAANIQKEKSAPVLPKEELQFMTALKTEPEKKTAEEIRAEEESVKKAAEEKIRAQEQAKKEADKKAEALANINKKFDYDIRVAAFRSEAQADELRLKLETDGFRTRKNVKKDTKGNWYFIHVLLIGTEERLKESQERFKKFGVRDSIIESKVEAK